MAAEGSEPIPPKPKNLKQFKRHVRKLSERRESGKDGFEEEFIMIEKSCEVDLLSEDFVTTRLPQNKMKNRYTNVLPYEKTRVHLPEFPGVAGSDYINANYIDGDPMVPNSKNCYIASQGPLPTTVIDFWRMVWNEMSSMIVMLTKIVENEKQKCDQYWPKKGWNRIGDLFLVSCYSPPLLDTNELILTKMRMDYLPTGACRDIYHLQYREWPDFGIPNGTEKFRQMLDIVDYFETPATPTIVHCSAGIGRTGTFCTIHKHFSKMKYFHSLHEDIFSMNLFDVQATVAKLRKDRVGMVQTKDQYIFCYHAILEGASAFRKMIKEKKFSETDFLPITTSSLDMLSEICKSETFLPSDYEEARRIRLSSVRNPYKQKLKDDLARRNKTKGKMKGKKKKKKEKSNHSDSSSSDDSSSPRYVSKSRKEDEHEKRGRMNRGIVVQEEEYKPHVEKKVEKKKKDNDHSEKEERKGEKLSKKKKKTSQTQLFG